MSSKSLPKLSDLLTDAKTLLVDKGWTQKTLARNEAGEVVEYTSSEATCYCSIGAVWAATLAYNPDPENKTKLFTEVMTAINILHHLSGKYTYISTWNDQPERTKEEVLLMFDTAIEKAKENE